MKKVYFVRHAESEGNVSSTFQSLMGSLTECGRHQARVVADRLSDTPFDHIISSTMARAKETAEEIARGRGVQIVYSELFRERKRPTTYHGLSRNDPVLISAEKEIMAHLGEHGWRYGDEETFDELKGRALEALDYIISFEGERVLVVTHGIFMRIILAVATCGMQLTGPQCAGFLSTYYMANTGINIFSHEEKRGSNPWWLWAWNDHSHLDGESHNHYAQVK